MQVQHNPYSARYSENIPIKVYKFRAELPHYYEYRSDSVGKKEKSKSFVGLLAWLNKPGPQNTNFVSTVTLMKSQACCPVSVENASSIYLTN
jgi:hypothetical protein